MGDLLTKPVEPLVVSEIKDQVEPVTCRGGADADHDPVEAEPVDSGVGYVTYECGECGIRIQFHHSKDTPDPCCAPRDGSA